MVFPMEERKCLKGKNRLICAYGELNYLLEKFGAAEGFFRRILQCPNSDNVEKAMAHIGLGACSDLQGKPDEKEHFEKALELSKKSPVYGNALMRLGLMYVSSSPNWTKELEFFEEYLKLYREGGVYWKKAKFHQMLCYAHVDVAKAKRLFLESGFEKKYPDSGYTKSLRKMLFENNGKKEAVK